VMYVLEHACMHMRQVEHDVGFYFDVSGLKRDNTAQSHVLLLDDTGTTCSWLLIPMQLMQPSFEFQPFRKCLW
jgi:hypothetical protein